MAYRKEKFENGNIVHVILRGIDGNVIFRDIADYYRGIFSVYEFNNINPVIIRERRRTIAHFKKNYKGPTSVIFSDNRERMVDLLCFCFMPNHLHLLVRQLKDGGITEYIRKIGTGYGGYFNRKYQRKGHLFQDVFKAVHIETDEQLMTVVAYIHTNPLSLKYSEWKEIRIKNPEEAMRFLEEYKWSSHLDCIGIQNFSSVTQRDSILDLFDGVEKYKEFILDYIAQKGELKKYTELFLE
jgi:putative transposase